jgi:hypothetical protein
MRRIRIGDARECQAQRGKIMAPAAA